MNNDRIRINLLPSEHSVVQKERSKKRWVIRVSSFIIAAVAIITASVLGFGIIKNEEQKSLIDQSENLRAEISSMSQQEGYLALIKQKLVAISRLKIEDSTKLATLETYLRLIPTSVKITTTNLDRAGEISFNGQADSLSSLNQLVQNLTDPSRNSNKVTQIKFNSLSKDSANAYRFDMTVFLK